MNYYKQGNAAKAEQIKAAFEDKGYDTTGWKFNVEGGFYYTTERKRIDLACGNFLINLIKTHPDYQELKLPAEHKFKVGDWLVFNDSHNSIYQISEIRDSYYMLTHTHGGSMPLSFSQGKFIRPWSIEDAKDGDVLVTTKVRNCPFIYRKTNSNHELAFYYAGIDGNGDFCEGCLKRTLYHFGSVSDVAPATKEQRDLLFAKMKEAGYQWDADKKELRKIIKPKFKVGDEIKTGNTIDTVAEIGYATRSYYCESGRTISFENQDLWHLATKPHYDIANFKPFDKVLVRDRKESKWGNTYFGFYDEEHKVFVCDCYEWEQCIPFNDKTKHLLGTTDMCPEEYVNW